MVEETTAEAEVSVEDRVADHFGGAPSEETQESEVEETEAELEEATEPEADPEPPKVEGEETTELEIDGVVYAIPNAIKDGYLKSADYTQKTQELSRSREAVELVANEQQQWHQQQQFQASIAPEISQMNNLDAMLKHYDGLNWSEMTTDELVRTKHDRDQIERAKKEITEGLATKQNAYLQHREQAQVELIEKGKAYLTKAIPDWSEDVAKAVGEYAMGEGYTAADLNGLSDTRYAKTLYKAMQYDKLQAGAAEAVEKVSKTPTIVPKSSKPMPSKTKDYLKYRKQIKNPNLSKGKKNDLLLERIGGKF